MDKIKFLKRRAFRKLLKQQLKWLGFIAKSQTNHIQMYSHEDFNIEIFISEKLDSDYTYVKVFDNLNFDKVQ